MNKKLDAVIKAVKDTGEFEAILSMPTLDRDGEIIDAGAFAPLPSKITIDIDHGMSVATTVGSGTPYYTSDGVLMFTGKFASTALAQDVRALVVEGHVDRMSVAYTNANYVPGDDGVPHLRSAELLNAAIVGIPANREAAILVAKALEKGVRSAKDVAAVQAIYTHAVALGAVCPTCAEKAAPEGDEKSAETNPESISVKAPAPSAAADTAIDVPAAVHVAMANAVLAQADMVLLDL